MYALSQSANKLFAPELRCSERLLFAKEPDSFCVTQQCFNCFARTSALLCDDPSGSFRASPRVFLRSSFDRALLFAKSFGSFASEASNTVAAYAQAPSCAITLLCTRARFCVAIKLRSGASVSQALTIAVSLRSLALQSSIRAVSYAPVVQLCEDPFWIAARHCDARLCRSSYRLSVFNRKAFLRYCVILKQQTVADAQALSCAMVFIDLRARSRCALQLRSGISVSRAYTCIA